jgi:hypothetical protein
MLLVSFCVEIHAKEFKEEAAHEQLKKQIILKNYKSAWEITTQYETEYLGDVEFDFLYGITALHVNELEHATFAFERVVANKPAWIDAQYYLASSYFKMANYQAAIEITNKLNEIESVSSKLKVSINNLQKSALIKLEKQSLYISQLTNFDVGYDSNVNAGTREENIYLPFLGENVALSESSRENSDNYVSLGYMLYGNKVLSQTSKLSFSGSSQLYLFMHEADYNRISIDTSLQYIKDFDDFGASIGIKITPLWFNERYYRTQAGLTIGLNKQIQNNWRVSTEAYVGKIKNNVNDKLNTDVQSIQFSGRYQSRHWRHSLSMVYSKELSEFVESQHNDRKTNAINFSSIWLINSNWLASAAISFQRQEYQFEHPFFFEKRADDMWMLGSSIQYQTQNALIYKLSANIQDKDSNLSLFSYQRADIRLSASMNF